MAHQTEALRLKCRECRKIVGEIRVGTIDPGTCVICLDCQQKIDKVLLFVQDNQKIGKAIMQRAVGNPSVN